MSDADIASILAKLEDLDGHMHDVRVASHEHAGEIQKCVLLVEQNAKLQAVCQAIREKTECEMRKEINALIRTKDRSWGVIIGASIGASVGGGTVATIVAKVLGG